VGSANCTAAALGAAYWLAAILASTAGGHSDREGPSDGSPCMKRAKADPDNGTGKSATRGTTQGVQTAADRANNGRVVKDVERVGVGEHPDYGTPPDPDAEIRMVGSKPVWVYFNDKGEEVVVVCHWPIYVSNFVLCYKVHTLFAVFSDITCALVKFVSCSFWRCCDMTFEVSKLLRFACISGCAKTSSDGATFVKGATSKCHRHRWRRR
jgi:hypothetical protein